MISTLKSQLRIELQQRRDSCQKSGDLKVAGQALLHNLMSANIIPFQAIVGSYWPVKSEADVRPLLSYLYEHGHVCALPIFQAPNKPLLFREWRPGNLLVSGLFNILTPDDEAPLATPNVLFVPIIGFDRKGHRLGYGEGCYDRTLKSLRALQQVTAIGIAFDYQEVEEIPHEEHDELMNYIVTPTQVIEIKK